MPNPSSIARFGVSVVGKQFEWTYPSDDGNSTGTLTARAAAAINFEDVLRYTTGRHAQLVQTAKSAQAMKVALKELDPSDDDYSAQFEKVVQGRLAFEADVWAAAIDILLILVNKADHDALRPLLIDGDPKQVNMLRSWLEQEVLASAVDDAQTAAQVDPTLRPPPPPSAPSPDFGVASDSEGSASTD